MVWLQAERTAPDHGPVQAERKAVDDDVAAYGIRSITQGKGGRAVFLTNEEEQFDAGMRNMAMDFDAHIVEG